MAKRKELIASLKSLAEKLGKTPTLMDVHNQKKFSEFAIRREFGKFSEALKAAGLIGDKKTPGSIADQSIMRSRIKELEGELELERARAMALSRFSGMQMREPPKWLDERQKKRGITGVPQLLLSDLHFDEVVRAEEINGANEYNREIAVRRLERTFKQATWLCQSQFAAPKFDGIVCALGGDMVSGNIHEELAETNQNRILRTCLDLSAYLVAGIKSLADSFGNVYVPCVAGNHGRIKKKPQYKYRAQDNYDWLIYQMVARELAGDKRVQVVASESSDILFHSYGLRFLLTHGDQFSGGSGISGIFTPLMLGAHRKQKRQSYFDQPFDVMLMGHFHQLIQTQSLIVNGSVKGYDEYAFQHNFPPEPAQQSLVIVSEHGRITHAMPVFCDAQGAESKAIERSPLVTWAGRPARA